MIDTIILTIPRNKIITISSNTWNEFPRWELQKNEKGYSKHIKNTSDKEVKQGLSFIKLTGYKRGFGINKHSEAVKIEFSAPKLIKNNNNVNEVCEDEFNLVAKTLQERLKQMGEIVNLEDIENAEVCAFHPSKNIVLSDGYTSSTIINELSKININKKFDKTNVVFANDGASLQIRTEGHSIVFYDKVADLRKDSKRAIDKDQTLQQQSLFVEIKKKQPTLEILRMEVRLSQKRKMKEIMKKMGFNENPTFRDIFKKDVCQKIVRWYWEEIIKGENLFLFELTNNPKRLLRKIVNGDKKIKQKRAIFLSGLSVLCKDEGGIRELREILEKCTKQRSWYRIINDIKFLNEITNKKALHSWVKQIEDSIDNFKPYHTESKRLSD